MRPAMLLLSCVAILLAANNGSAPAATRQICSTDPYGTRTCTDSVDVKRTKAPHKARVKKKTHAK